MLWMLRNGKHRIEQGRNDAFILRFLWHSLCNVILRGGIRRASEIVLVDLKISLRETLINALHSTLASLILSPGLPIEF